MILWHRDTDRFEDGQWLKQRVYPDCCHLSPDGQHFIYFALDAHWDSETKGSYTGISRPPYFTALALFPVGDTWSGGGAFFVDNHHVFVDGDPDIIGRAAGLSRVELGKPDPKGCTTDIRLRSGLPAPLSRQATKLLLEDPVPTSRSAMRYQLRHASAHLGAAYHCDGGKLYRSDGSGQAALIRDFTDMAFEPIRAPYDWRGETGATEGEPSWHPLDGAGA
ncbi:hypothetical protein AIOL_001218 [Candidatus Rhodobacter oscarellae]|uniref:Uncharacterized protein n=2 Tax=Candidatus Rhodobacter oscarellae TaxID=1675527 RepID=A0A0J9E007_9RHOB|nr:hypothetical protein AIOL_001218 [Candidatus Rhodobacter lobularis]